VYVSLPFVKYNIPEKKSIRIFLKIPRKYYGFMNTLVKNISLFISCVWSNVSHRNTNTK